MPSFRVRTNVNKTYSHGLTEVWWWDAPCWQDLASWAEFIERKYIVLSMFLKAGVPISCSSPLERVWVYHLAGGKGSPCLTLWREATDLVSSWWQRCCHNWWDLYIVWVRHWPLSWGLLVRISLFAMSTIKVVYPWIKMIQSYNRSLKFQPWMSLGSTGSACLATLLMLVKERTGQSVISQHIYSETHCMVGGLMLVYIWRYPPLI